MVDKFVVFVYMYACMCACMLNHFSTSDCHPMDCSLPGSSVHGTLQTRRLDRTHISYVSSIGRWVLLSLCHLGIPCVCVCVCVCVNTCICCCSVAKLCLTLCNPMDCSLARLLCPWDFPGKNIGAGCHCLLIKASV